MINKRYGSSTDSDVDREVSGGENADEHNSVNLNTDIIPDDFVTKPGIRLPKTSSDWTLANLFFHAHFSAQLAQPIMDLNNFVSQAQTDVYNYFAKTHGTIAQDNNSWDEKYNHLTAKQLKATLRGLKRDLESNNDASEVKSCKPIA